MKASIMELEPVFENAVMKAIVRHSKQFDNWAFDERDNGCICIDEYIEKIMKRPITEEERKGDVYVEAEARCRDLENAAINLARQGRLGTRVSLAEAEELFHSLKN